jgi:hypothetical protein
MQHEAVWGFCLLEPILPLIPTSPSKRSLPEWIIPIRGLTGSSILHTPYLKHPLSSEPFPLPCVVAQLLSCRLIHTPQLEASKVIDTPSCFSLHPVPFTVARSCACPAVNIGAWRSLSKTKGAPQMVLEDRAALRLMLRVVSVVEPQTSP